MTRARTAEGPRSALAPTKVKSMPRPSAPKNLILSLLSPRDLALLQPDLQALSFGLDHSLEQANVPIEHICFLESGFASVVAKVGSGKAAEIGIIGREGVTGSAVIMGSDRSPHDTYIQSQGTGHFLSATKLRRAMARSESLRTILLKSVLAFNVQTAQTALANAKGKMEQRLARWLLMAQDRIRGDEIPLTHDFIALMLGVRRPGVTVALKGHDGRGRAMERIDTHQGMLRLRQYD